MSSLNKVMIIGNLGKDPELKYTASQKAVVTLSVATKEFATVNGQKTEKTEWHRVQVWEKLAENCSKYLKKGSPIYAEGRLQTREWTSKTGEKHQTTEIIASNIQFLSAPKEATPAAQTQAPHPAQTAPSFNTFDPNEIPF